MAGADNFSFKRNVDVEIRNVASGGAEGFVAGADDFDAFEQAHEAVHLEAKVGDAGQGDLAQMVGPMLVDVSGELDRGLFAPVGEDALEIERRVFALEFVFLSEIDFESFAIFAVAQDGFGFAGVVIAVVVEEDDFSADLGLEFAGGLDLGVEESFGKDSAGLLAEADDGGGGHEACEFSMITGKPGRSATRRFTMGWMAQAKATRP